MGLSNLCFLRLSRWWWSMLNKAWEPLLPKPLVTSEPELKGFLSNLHKVLFSDPFNWTDLGYYLFIQSNPNTCSTVRSTIWKKDKMIKVRLVAKSDSMQTPVIIWEHPIHWNRSKIEWSQDLKTVVTGRTLARQANEMWCVMTEHHSKTQEERSSYCSAIWEKFGRHRAEKETRGFE